uniref:Uncharacterized protein n=1 Tax=Rousettus aegyptiacus TaxID=9407 RepID=A0A7J8H913_ROUAE|nr:hypothetical protein HJG63_020552 [Rousettus aegyptiacus]
MVATISSQHSNCPLSPIEYLGDDKMAALVINNRTLLLPAPLFLDPDLVLHSVFHKCSILLPINLEGVTLCSFFIPMQSPEPPLHSHLCP